jgi:polar amino acid transport system substrate-binding protein
MLALSQLHADTFDEIKKRGVIRWGGDEEGGAPYIIVTENKTRPAGFEGDLMEALAKRLGVQPEFKQCQWDNLSDLLRTGGVDIICNGVELRKDRVQTNLCTIPYYVNDLQLVSRKEDSRLKGWADLQQARSGKKWQIGVLSDTAAERYMKENYPDSAEAISYPGTLQAMDHVRDEKLDATLTDWMAANTYANRYPTLHFVGEAVGRGYFVIYLRPGDERLRDELNASLREMMADGRLKLIYDKYQIWNDAQLTLVAPEVQQLPDQMRSGEERKRGWAVIRENFFTLLEAAGMTVLLSVTSMPLAIVLGLLIALGRLFGPAFLRAPLAVYVEVIRGTPLLLQLFFLFYVLPWAIHGVVALPDWWNHNFALIAAVSGLAVNYSAYEAEIYRAGLQAIPAGQMEAALSLGLTRRQALRYVLVPQAVRIVIPPVTNDFIALFKDTSVCSAITIIELSKQYSIVANNTGAPLEIAAVTAFLYLAMSYPLSLVARRLEKRVPAINA